MGKRRSYSETELAERREADEAIRDGAAQLLADGDAVASMVAYVVGTESPKLLRYSLRNVAMLIRQAKDRGMILTDVDSYRGWRERGRGVRKGERALRIVAPKGIGDAGTTEGDSPEGAACITTGDEADSAARVGSAWCPCSTCPKPTGARMRTKSRRLNRSQTLTA